MKSTLHVSQSAGRALALLDLVISDGPIALGDAAERTAMVPSTALRHLRALVAGGWLAQDAAGRYTGGPTSLRLALRLVGDGPFTRLMTAAEPCLDALSAATGETAYLAIRDGTEAVYVASSESRRAIRHAGWVGRSVPVAGTAVGDALCMDPALAGSAASAAVSGAAGSAAPDASGVTVGEERPVFENVGALEPDVAGASVAVVVDGMVVAALSVLGPAERFDPSARAAARPALVDASSRLAAAIGGSGDERHS